MKKKKVVIGLSGGVDSSVAAALLIEQGYEVEAVYLECYNEPGCRTDTDKKDALQVAIKLGIPFRVLDLRKEYKAQVVEYFYAEYEAGRTPNPDVMCNREIKFGIFYDYAISQGYDYVATGHYCRITEIPNSKFEILNKSEIRNPKQNQKQLQMAKDKSKDQSYFLWQVPREKLEHILFPLGSMLKSEVRAKAKELGLQTASKPDSMGICFIGEVNVAKLLKDRLGDKPGEVIMKNINQKPEIRNSKQIRNQKLEIVANLKDDHVVVGRHRGLWFYTIGERGGFEIDKSKLKKLGLHPESMEPLYVIDKNVEKNELVVGRREESMTSKFRIWKMGDGIRIEGTKLWVRIRNLGELYECSISQDTNKVRVIETNKPVFGVASGQSAVFYDEQGILVAGGIIV